MNEKILQVVKDLREKSEKRNFSQTFDLIINLKEYDLKKPENKFTEEVILLHGRGEDARVVIFSDVIKEPNIEVFSTEEVNGLVKNKRNAKKLVGETEFFLAEPKLMPVVGKVLGQFIGPKGKLPKIISGNIKQLIENYKKSVRIRVKDSPVIQCLVGKENMKDEDVAENIESVLKFLENRLPKGKHNIGKILLKLTMGKPVKLEV